MLIREMVAAVLKRTGVGQRKARELISDGAERLDLATEGLQPYTDQDVVDWAVLCYEEDVEYENDPGEN